MSAFVEDPEKVALELEALKTRLLFDEERQTTQLSPIAEQHYLEALLHLELAAAKFRTAEFFRRRDW